MQDGGLQSLNVGALRKKAEEAGVDKEAIEDARCAHCTLLALLALLTLLT
jgi:hypothetical protein